MRFLISLLAGFVGHYVLFDVCEKLPMSDLSKEAAGVLIAYPLLKIRFEPDWDFDRSFFATFLGLGVGVFCARVFRSRIE